MRRVGYWISEKKSKKLNFEDHRQLFMNAGIDLIKIDLKQTLETQGPFDLIVHKVTDILAKAIGGHESSQHAIQNLESYIQSHPECVVLDPLDSIRRLLDRYTQYQQVSRADFMKDRRTMIPPFVELDSTSVSENKKRIAEQGVTFPLVCKPILAHGSTLAHQMSIIFSEEGLKDIIPPCVAQSFINHNAILYKILVVGCRQFIIQRPSLKNLYPGNYQTIFFDTQEVSKADSDHPLNALDAATLEDQPTKPDWVYLDRLGQGMREIMELDLFGFDVIIDSKTNQYGIIDINFFPGFESIDNFFGVLLEHIVKVLDARDCGALVNGRFMPTAQDLDGGVSILNQLNLFSRSEVSLPQENQVNSQCGREPLFESLPVIDLSPRSLALATSTGERTVGGLFKGKNSVIVCSEDGENQDSSVPLTCGFSVPNQSCRTLNNNSINENTGGSSNNSTTIANSESSDVL